VADDSKGESAIKLWAEQKVDLYAGRKPRGKSGGLTVYELTQRFPSHKKELLDTGEIATRTFAEYKATCERLDIQLGSDRLVNDLAADEFGKLRANIAKTWGPTRLGNEIQRVRSVFKFANDSGLIDKTIRFGPGFQKPSAKTLQKNQRQRACNYSRPSRYASWSMQQSRTWQQ